MWVDAPPKTLGTMGFSTGSPLACQAGGCWVVGAGLCFVGFFTCIPWMSHMPGPSTILTITVCPSLSICPLVDKNPSQPIESPWTKGKLTCLGSPKVW